MPKKKKGEGDNAYQERVSDWRANYQERMADWRAAKNRYERHSATAPAPSHRETRLQSGRSATTPPPLTKPPGDAMKPSRQ